jgi:ParB-like chromosome segregation protein Spo0J
MKLVKITNVKANPKNPRTIKDEKFNKLVKSIQEFPDMLNKRPLIVFTDVDGKYVTLGGNMRLKACKQIGLKEVPVILADEWTEEQKAEFLIKDNVGFGEWDWDSLANEWDAEKLDDWGLNIPNFNNVDYSEKNEEIDIDLLDTEMILKLKYTEEDYNLVREQLSKIASTPEQAIWKLLGNE